MLSLYKFHGLLLVPIKIQPFGIYDSAHASGHCTAHLGKKKTLPHPLSGLVYLIISLQISPFLNCHLAKYTVHFLILLHAFQCSRHSGTHLQFIGLYVILVLYSSQMKTVTVKPSVSYCNFLYHFFSNVYHGLKKPVRLKGSSKGTNLL